MEIRIAGHTFSQWNEATVTLKYDSVASTFSFNLYYDPTNAAHRKIFRPLSYHTCEIYHQGVLLLTGTVLSHVFFSAGNPPVSLVRVSGYSKTGVLEDCPCVEYPLQTNNTSFADIVRKMCKHYGINVVIDDEVAEACETIIPSSNPEPDDKIAQYLDKMATHLNVILSHDRFGNLVLTKVKSDKMLTTEETRVRNTPTPLANEIEGSPYDTQYGTEQVKKQRDRAVLFDFTDRAQWLNMELEADGQKIHTDIVVVSQDNAEVTTNAVESEVLWNPFIETFTARDNVFDQMGDDTTNRGARPDTIVQTRQVESADNAAPKTARSVMGDELKNIRLRISVDKWVLNGHVITPNQMLTAQNPEVFLHNKTKMFIQEVSLYGNQVEETAMITSVPPSAFGTDDVVSIF